MNRYKKISFYPAYPYKTFSRKAIEYINSLSLDYPIRINLNCLHLSRFLLGEGEYFTKVISIKQSSNQAQLDNRICHELSHFSLLNRCYHGLIPNGRPGVASVFQHLLHHIAIYPKLKKQRLLYIPDDICVTVNAKLANMTQLQQLYNGGIPNYQHEVILGIINNLIMVPKTMRHEYIELLKRDLPEAFFTANNVYRVIRKFYTNLNLKNYIYNKNIIEKKLMMRRFDWQ